MGLTALGTMSNENDLKGALRTPPSYLLIAEERELQDQDLILGKDILPALKEIKIPDKGTDFRLKLRIDVKEMWELG